MKFADLIEDEVRRRMPAACAFLRDRIRDDIATPGHGIASPWWHPPYLQSGDLWNSLDYWPKTPSLHGRVGSTLWYSIVVELGYSPLHAPRPYLRRGLYAHGPGLAAILCAPI